MNAGGRIGGLPGGGPGGGRTPGGAMPGRKGGAYSDGKALQQNSRDPIFCFVKWIETFQQMKEGHQAVVLEALRQEGPGYIHNDLLRTILETTEDPTSIPGGAMLPSSPSSLASL